MTFSYGMRLACLCLEIIFLVNLAVSIVILGLSQRAARAATTMQPHRAAGLFFTLRLLPFVLSLCVIASLCIPSYLRYEQNTGSERIGLFCLVISVLGLAICLTSLYRGIGVLAQSYLIGRRWRRLPHLPSPMAAETRMLVAEEDGSNTPLLALVGIRRPRLIVSRRLLGTLSAEQLEAAMSHERGHLLSRDNLKRLFLAMAPGIFPFMGGFGVIEQQWERYAELAADEYATHGRIDRSIALAEALIQVARLGNIERRIPLTSSLSAHDLELALRVNRLMANEPAILSRERSSKLSWNSFIVFSAFAAFLMLLPEVLYPLHRLLESLLH